MEQTDPVIMRHRALEHIAMAALSAGRLLMETGSRAEVVRQGAAMVASGLGAEKVYVRVGSTSVGMTVSSGGNTITRMTGIGPAGVNLRLNQALRRLCARARDGGMTPDGVDMALNELVTATPRHSWILAALAVGLACAAFGRLLGIDWLAFGPVLAASTLAQGLRHHLLGRKVNTFITAAIVAFLASVLAGVFSRLLGSGTVETAMFSAVLLLVPGVQALNAQTDVLEGHPTLGSARAVSVFMILVFVAVGLWLAQTTVGFTAPGSPSGAPSLWHQTAFGAIAAAGFGVLFNFGWRTLGWAAGAGALALAVRTLGLEAGWSLAAASFAAAVAVGISLRLLYTLPLRSARAGNVLAVAGCIPMIPGSAAAHAILGLMALTAQVPIDAQATLLMTVEYGLRVLFTTGAIGAGLSIMTALLHPPDFSA